MHLAPAKVGKWDYPLLLFRCPDCGEDSAMNRTGCLPMKMLLAAFLLTVVTFSKTAEASPVDGAWIIRDLVLDIFDCDSLVCGRIVWIKDPARRSSQCGRTIVWGLASEGHHKWTGGSILDPDDETTYRLSATYEPDGTLHARIFRGVPLFGKTEILRRVDLTSLSGRC
jgi:uncharacterized protein (DUF2147 family)